MIIFINKISRAVLFRMCIFLTVVNFSISLQVECGPQTLKGTLIFHNHDYLSVSVVVLSGHMDPLINYFFFHSLFGSTV